MPSRKTTVKAPAARVYQSAPRTIQQKFPTPRRATRSIATPSAPAHLERQTTLTQIPFLPTSSSSLTDLSDLEQQLEEDFLDARPHKRRKVTGSSENRSIGKRQSTLTQLPFFYNIDEDEEEAEYEHGGEDNIIAQEGNDEDNRDAIMANSDYNTTAYPTEPLNPKSIYRDEPPKLCRVILDSRASTESPSPRIKRESQRKTAKSPSPAKLLAPPMCTPRRLPRNEIPSSQSPFATPISARLAHSQITPTPSLSKPSQRTPLEEIPANVLASRDSESPGDSPIAKKSPAKVKPRPKLRVADTFDAGLDSDEEWENFDPMEGPSKPAAHKSKDDGHDEEEEEDEDDDACVRRLDLKAFSPSKIHSSPRRSFHTAALPSRTPSPEPQVGDVPFSPTPRRSARSCSGLPAQQYHSSPPVRTARLQVATSPLVLPPRPNTPKAITQSSIRSSQATTVDVTQVTPRRRNHTQSQTQSHSRPVPTARVLPSPSKAASRHSSSNPPSSPPMRSYLPPLLPSSPYLETQEMIDRMGSLSPMASIENSEDVVTLSQLREQGW